MPTKQEFQNAIFSGLTNACEDAYHFSGDISALIRPEYVVTVNVAKELFNIEQSGYGYNFTVKFEQRTALFATHCVPAMAGNDIFNIKIRSFQNTERNGKIDITVYDQDGYRPICPIEIKDFHPTKTEVVLDLVRNIELLELNDTETGPSIINFAFLVALEEHKNCVYEKNKDLGLQLIKGKYEKRISQLVSSHPNIRFDIITKTVAKNLVDDTVPVNPNLTSNPDYEADYAESISDMYHFVGVIITTERI